MRTLRKLLSTVAVLATILAMTAAPAAAVAVASAAITTPSLFSGEDATVNVRITNNATSSGGVLGVGETAGSSIDAFQIEVPTAIFTPNAADPVTLPSGWNGGYDAETEMVWAIATEGSELPPDAAMDVTLRGTAVELADDATRNVPVFVSDNGGTTLTSAGVPTLASRILEILTVDVVKPASATNQSGLEVTQGQTTADVAVTVRNYGTTDRSVTVEADGSLIDTEPLTLTVPAGDAGDAPTSFVLDAVVDDVTGTTAPNATAASANSAAQPLGGAVVTVQEKFSAAYVADSLMPRNVRQGVSYDFVLDLAKAGAQPAVVDATFRILGVTSDTQADEPFGAGNVTTTLSFPGVTIPLVPNQTAATEVDLVGIDGNGADIAVTVGLDDIKISDLLPLVENLVADVGASQVAGDDPAATNNSTVDFTADVTIGSDDEAYVPCDDCTVEEAYVDVPGQERQDFSASITNGQLTGSGSFTYPAATYSATAVVVVASADGVPADAATTFVVDVTPPELLDPAVTGRDAAGDFITVTVAERATDTGTETDMVDASDTNRFDWSVDSNTVTAVEARPAANGATEFELRLNTALGDNETPTVSYAPPTVFSPRMNDRVGLTLADSVIDTVDGIAPLAPVIELVDGLARQDGEFWTNLDPQTTVTLSDLVPDDTLYVYFDEDGDGPELGERVFEGPVTAETQTVTLSGLPQAVEGQNTVGTLYAELFDGVQAGALAEDVLNIDVTAPVITAFSADGNNVTVTFNEPVTARGRDAAFDWTVTADQNGEVRARTVESVGAGASLSERVLTVSASSYDPAAGDVLGVRYKFRGVEEDRYDDRATNGLADQFFGSAS